MKVFKIIGVLGFSLLAACGDPQEHDSRVQGERDNAAQAALGVGYDVVAEEARDECVVVTPLEQKLSLGQPVEFSVTKIATNDVLNKAMNISASAYLKTGLPNASAKAKFAKSMSINAYSTYILVNVKVSTGSFEMKGVKIKDDAKDAYLRNPEEFRKKCGDEFISGYLTGDEYSSILQIDSKNTEEKSEIDKYIINSTWSFKDKDTFKSAIDYLSNKYSMKVFTPRPRDIADLIPTSVDEMLAQALDFPEKVTSGNTYNYQSLTKKYSSLTFPAGQPFVDTSVQEDVIARLAQARASNMDELNNIQFILENPLQFETPPLADPDLSNRKNKVIGNINSLSTETKTCFGDYLKCRVPVSADLPGVLPLRKAAAFTPD